MILDEIVQNSSLGFRIYADLHHGVKPLWGRIHGSGNSPYAEGIPEISTLKELADLATDRGAVASGREVLDGYAEDPDRTILLVAHEVSPTGAPAAMYRLIKLLQRKGWQVLVVTPKEVRNRDYTEDDSLSVIVLPELFCSDIVLRARKLFRAVIVNTLIGMPLIRQLNGTDTPVLWWIHENGETYTRTAARMIPRILTDNIHVFCAGLYAQRMLKERFPRYRTGILLYQAADLAKKTDTVPRKGEAAPWGRKYGIIGTIGRHKGQDVLLEAVDLLQEDVRNRSRYVFAGATRDADLEESVRRKGNADPGRFQFLGELDPEDVRRLYREIDFLICPSRDDCMPVVAAEAMSLGIPVLCSCNTGTAEIIEGYGAGLTYGKNDPGRLAQLIDESFNMPEDEYSRMSANARRAYEEVFSEEVFENSASRILGTLLDTNGRFSGTFADPRDRGQGDQT